MDGWCDWSIDQGVFVSEWARQAILRRVCKEGWFLVLQDEGQDPEVSGEGRESLSGVWLG